LSYYYFMLYSSRPSKARALDVFETAPNYQHST
jgi:hypothetical protein